MKMEQAMNACSLCNRTDVKFYDLKDSIRAPNDLRFEGHTNLQGVLEKILDEKRKYSNTSNETCQKCHDKLHGIYSFTHRRTESEKNLHQIADVAVRLKKSKTFFMLTDLKTEFEPITETGKDRDSPECSWTVPDMECDDSGVSKVMVKNEFGNNFEGTVFIKLRKDLSVGVLGGEYSNAADGRSVEQMKIDSTGSKDSEQITIEDQIIKEEWTMQEAEIFETKSNASGGFRDHKMSHAGVNFACNKCDASFSTKNYLAQHLRIVHTDALFACDDCDATYKSKQALKVHKQIHNGILFNCDQCDAKYGSNASLKYHKMSHTGVTFPCNKCDASFSNTKSLKRHLRGVHSDAVFSCDCCDASYKRNDYLKMHKLSHSGILFHCDQCDVKYKSKGSLRHHKISHTGVTFSCNECESSFSNERSLKNHMRVVHIGGVFSCEQCDATYKTERALNAHKLSQHAITKKFKQT